jgi:hypothetical protein
MAKTKKAAKPTPGKKAYAVICEAIAEQYADYSTGGAEDDDFTTPGKQKKVAKQLAKIHNRLLKKIPEVGLDELDEDPE